jgi:hypothetical protein
MKMPQSIAVFCFYWYQVQQDGYDQSYNLTQLISRFACLSPKESKYSKWQDGNFTNNLSLLILFILFYDC